MDADENKLATDSDIEFAEALEGTLGEWVSQNDNEAYRDL